MLREADSWQRRVRLLSNIALLWNYETRIYVTGKIYEGMVWCPVLSGEVLGEQTIQRKTSLGTTYWCSGSMSHVDDDAVREMLLS